MCFSASASFTAGALLSVIGIASIAKNKHTPYRFLAATPLLFAVQQIIESIVWLTHGQTTFLARAAPYAFLFFALLLWPVWISSVLWPTIPQNDTPRRYALIATFLAGCMTSLYFLFRLITIGATASISCSYIIYNLNLIDQPRIILMLLYGCATIVPCFISTHRILWLLGASLIASYTITSFFYIHYLTSVWCFFAALLSVMILFIHPASQSRRH